MTIDLPTQPRFSLPNVEILRNPSQDQLRKLALEHTPFCQQTALGSIAKVARNKARQARFTYVIDRRDQPAAFSHQTIDPKHAQRLIDQQRAYMVERGKLVAIEGYVGVGPYATAVQWLYTLEGSNIAGMQQVLAFPREAVEDPATLELPFAPQMRVVYTPDCFVDLPGQQCILVDLDEYVTYIMGADYFGESKKGALRMLAAAVYEQGGLLMHAGAKAVHAKGRPSQTVCILGLSGTGKTTTTFSKQGDAIEPVQDDMLAIWPAGALSVTENGCFAKTDGLAFDREPVLYRGSVDPTAWLENVYIDEHGQPDFSKGLLAPHEVERLEAVLVGTGAPQQNVDSTIADMVELSEVFEDGVPKNGWEFVEWTGNGRSIIPMTAIDNAADLCDVPPLGSIGLLNRDEGPDAATPGLVRFASPEQAAAYFMLGETSKTSASGKERGRTRSPFTQPFFPLAHHRQAERFSALVATFGDIPMWMMNTGYIGGTAAEAKAGQAINIAIRHSSAMLEALFTGEVAWVRDPDFGYDIVDVDDSRNTSLLASVPAEILQPRRYFARVGKLELYQRWVEQMKGERVDFLRKHHVDPAIIASIS